MNKADILDTMAEQDIAQCKRLGIDPYDDAGYYIGYQHGRAAGLREAHAMLFKNRLESRSENDTL